ncbi:MAG TPA: beta-eliminating lyase-related protein [Candidatus Thermoplasmatota archaeon]|nr:beta-eliminating lyase-related protein [Candidatus Thermoplasmatota archaeon]
MRRAFASDNNAAVHPKVLAAIAAANEGHARAYGDDAYTQGVAARFSSLFGREVDVFFVFNGTGANVLGLSALVRPYDAILCAEGAHIATDEANAPERALGCKLVTIPTPDGKLTPALIEPHIRGVGSQHHAQPRVVSITQSSELGTVYGRDELFELRRSCDANHLYLHMDGARIANAAAVVGSLQGATEGVHVMSFGGTKNGALAAEAVIFLHRGLAEGFAWRRKQGMQLASKMRYIAAQFDALLTDELWLENARHANAMASLLSREAEKVPGVRLAQRTQANEVFATLPRDAIAPLMGDVGFFEVWDERADLVRWVCSWDTTEEDVRGFIDALRRVMGKIA